MAALNSMMYHEEVGAGGVGSTSDIEKLNETNRILTCGRKPFVRKFLSSVGWIYRT